MTGPAPTPPSGEPGAAPQGKKELAQAFDALVSASAAKQLALETPAPPPPRRRARAVFVMTLVAAIGVVIAVRAPAGGETPARASDVRAAMLVVARRIRAFQAEHGRSPQTLRELGDAPPGMAYRIINAETWELRGARGPDTLSLRSDQDPAAFFRDTIRPAGEPPTP